MMKKHISRMLVRDLLLRSLPYLWLGISLLALSGCGGNSSEYKTIEVESKIPIGGVGFLNITVKNRKEIKGPITVTLEKLPTGINVQNGGPASQTLEKPGDAKAKFTLVAGENLSLEKPIVTTVALKGTNLDSKEEIKIFVRDFTLDSTGSVMMGISIVAVLILTGFCIYRVLTLPPLEAEEHLKGPLEIDTGDTENAD